MKATIEEQLKNITPEVAVLFRRNPQLYRLFS